MHQICSFLQKGNPFFNVATFDVSLFSGGTLSFRVVAEFRGVASLEGSLLWRVFTFNGSLLSELYGILYAIKGMLHLVRYTRCLRNSLRFSTQIRLFSVDFQFHVQGSNKFQEVFSLPHTGHKNDARA